MTDRHADKLRLANPIIGVSNLMLLGIIGWFAIQTYNNIHDETRLLFQKYDAMNKKAECLAHNIDKCCKDSVQCV